MRAVEKNCMSPVAGGWSTGSAKGVTVLQGAGVVPRAAEVCLAVQPLLNF